MHGVALVPQTKLGDGMQGTRGRYIALAGFVSLVALLVLGVVAHTSQFMRPVADDYCFGSVAGRGFLPALTHWFTTWGGDLTLYGSNTLFVGLPLANLPWPVVSSIAFFATAGAVAIAACVFVSPGVSHSRRQVLLMCLFGVMVPMLWWSYWWTSIAVASGGSDDAAARAIAFWQNINSAYVIPTALLIAGLALADRAARGPLRIVLAVLLGLAIGVAGPVLAVSVLATLALYRAAAWLFALTQPRMRQLGAELGFALAVVIGAVVSYLAPGSQARRASQGVMPEVNPQGILSWVFPEAIRSWLSLVLNPGSLLVLLIGALLGCLLVLGGLSAQPRRIAGSVGGLLALSAVMTLVNRLSELFVYRAYWHQIAIGTAVFLGLVAAGFWVGARLALSDQAGAPAARVGLTGVALFAALPLAVLATGTMTAEVKERYARWEAGPAPVFSTTTEHFLLIADTEDGSGWIRCWVDLGTGRDIPKRIPAGQQIPELAPIPT